MKNGVNGTKRSLIAAALGATLISQSGLYAQSVPVGPDAPADTSSAPPLPYEGQAPVRSPSAEPAAPATAIGPPVDIVLPPVEPLPEWTRAQGQALVQALAVSADAGLDPADYGIDALRAALATKKKPDISALANASFLSLARDLRDGRTPKEQRLEWYIVDTDAQSRPAEAALRSAVASGDIAGTLAGLEPDSPDYRALRAALAATPPGDGARVARLRANLDRWRWLPQSLGARHIFVNVPAYKLRLVDAGTVKTEHRVIVGTPKTSTPQLDAMVQGVIFNPSWYLPQSILKEGIGAQIRSNPAAVRARGYDWTKAENGTIYARQLPGPNNALGLVKVDMPNDHAIFIHDTPGKHLFEEEVRAFSHGCMRTDKAMYLAGMLSGYFGGKTPKEIGDIVRSGETTKVPVKEPFPVYIAYFTAAPGADGGIVLYDDIYGRDAPLIKAFAPNAKAAASAGEAAQPGAAVTNPALTKDERDLLN